jgi:hypothetical protein
VVQVVTSHDLILDSFVVKLNSVLSIVTPEYKQVFYSKLFGLAPPNLESQVFLPNLSFQSSFIQQIIYFLIIDLDKTNTYRDVLILNLFCLSEDVFDSSNTQTCINVVTNWLARTICFLFGVLVTLHCISFARTCLVVSKYRRVEARNDF